MIILWILDSAILISLISLIGIIGFLFKEGFLEKILLFLKGFTASGFIYIASADLLPELHKQKDIRKANVTFFTFILGLLFMLGKDMGLV